MEKARIKLQQVADLRIKKRNKRILDEIKLQDGHTAYSLSIKLEISLRTIQRAVNQLVAEGILSLTRSTSRRIKNVISLNVLN